MTKIITARTTIVSIGNRQVEGLLLDDDSFGISIIQINEQLISFSTSRNTVSRDLKRLLGKDFIPSKVRTDIYKQLINAIPLEQLEKVIAALARKKNLQAIELSIELIGLSLNQLWADAFDIKFEKAERQEWLKKRQLTIESFWFMADAIKAYYEKHPRQEKYNGQNYAEVFDTLNVGLFGKRSRIIKKELGIGKSKLNRDHFGKDALKRIEMIQRIAEAQIMSFDKHPVEAVQFALNVLNYDVIDYHQ